jgi:hypothetical protein
VAVLVEVIPPVLSPTFSVEGLTEAVELRVRQSGIPVVGAFTEATVPYIYVNVNALQVRDMYVYNIQVEFRRPVSIFLPPDFKEKVILAALWRKGSLGTTVNPRTIRDYIIDDVESFLNDFLKANPRR